MNHREDDQDGLLLTKSEVLVTATVAYAERALELDVVKRLFELRQQLAHEIISETERAVEIEKLIELEMLYQRLDKYFAVSKPDLSSIDAARIGYLQIAETVRLMRRAPAAYMASNISAYETKMNPRKIDKTKALKQIWANKTRLQNRANFASSDWRDIWKARIGLADRTETMYRALHKKLAEDYGRKMVP